MPAMITVLCAIVAASLLITLLALCVADQVRREVDVLRRDVADLEASYVDVLKRSHPERLARTSAPKPYRREVRRAVA
ncbi:hypothetical protein CDOO_01860 [Corynebacterium doosanense CAU 212 = DSM 45436]|uniref:Uncharacterized protein n=2 Tax=Corynebacterium TaxID=1716 RepID=A0A097IJ51_9CORY|nr:hypothetical protein CDOO_01860 [Corynebacterium doosanense CAU 212 = DSM 45436]